MGRFSQRSTAKELMDFPIQNEAEIFENFDEIVLINKYLGGAQHSWAELKRLGLSHGDTIVDVGSGACDFFDYIENRASGHIEYKAIDIMPEAHAYARTRFPHLESRTEFITEDYSTWLSANEETAVVHASLFCHHLGKSELIEFFRLASRASKTVIINDLHRHPLAYYSIKWLTALFSKSRYTRNDAPLSVLRGFKRNELKDMLSAAGIDNYSIKWKWAFRFIVVIKS